MNQLEAALMALPQVATMAREASEAATKAQQGRDRTFRLQAANALKATNAVTTAKWQKAAYETAMRGVTPAVIAACKAKADTVRRQDAIAVFARLVRQASQDADLNVAASANRAAWRRGADLDMDVRVAIIQGGGNMELASVLYGKEL